MDTEGGLSLNISDVFNEVTYSQRPLTPRRFGAWLRPRKQVVRQIQWGSEIAWLLTQKQADDRSLRYLGLPGSDLLDVRYFYRRFCEEGEHILTFLGFDNSARADSRKRDALNISLNEVRRLEQVDTRSDVLGDDFRRLADTRSIAWEQAERIGPFDIINVDLCDYIASDEPTIDLSYYNAIHSLCGIQQRCRRPWSLFLTSRIDQEHVADDALAKLLEALKGNLQGCQGFALEFENNFGPLEYTIQAAQSWAPDVFFKAMSVAIAKWFLGMAQSMRNDFSLSSIAGYQVNRNAPYLDMVSLVLRFIPSPTIGPDCIGLASKASPLTDECSQATPLPKKVASVIDIDQALKNRPDTWRRFRDDTSELLELARYSGEDYCKWADDDLAKNNEESDR